MDAGNKTKLVRCFHLKDIFPVLFKFYKKWTAPGPKMFTVQAEALSASSPA
ncbi:unnamed protein product [Dovyalis caffra]|uniref:Uncharacterized protein n=1 Tax=Dovyalis caffra TaxID=77055 RepID=A0AAV1QR12_9ROSI|nr:unnamed protein product [Dovyalis caffra]